MQDNIQLSAVAFVVLLVSSGALVGITWGDIGAPSETENVSAGVTFTDVAAEAGFEYTSHSPSSVIVNGGVYVADYDRDGWPDLLAVGGDRPVLFENEDGKFSRSGALPRVNGTVEGALWFDYDGDGWEDLVLLVFGKRPVLLENQQGQFVRVRGAFERPLTYPVGATTAHYDGDGCLDLFIYQYADWSDKRPEGVHRMNVSGAGDNGNPNFLYRGDCSGTFDRVSSPAIRGARWSLAASFTDLTGDGAPDIHVANDYNNDVVYVNQGGSFEQIILGNATNRNAMSSEVGDVNGDNRIDLFVTNIQLPEPLRSQAGPDAVRMRGNNLLINRDNGSFRPAASAYGVSDGGWGWGAVLADFDNDGDQDIFHTTKHVSVTPMVRAQITRNGTSVPEFVEDHPELVYPRFFERTNGSFITRDAAVMGFNRTSGTGVARLDFDRDGDLDLAVAQVDGRYYLYENRLAATTNWLRLQIRNGGNAALGANVYITVDSETRYRRLNARSDFLSQDSRAIHVGVGTHDRVDRIHVIWPNGSSVVLRDVAVDQRIVLTPAGRANETA